ncbi:zinc-binding dehydrogenase [Neobacillus sp. NRS-1170]|uniref:zinc-binding dehydrogenase n=1 Tax=Neobacillus sp. NRS-1170 TaxID=3233898 RepID=UPI003D27FDCE
MKGKLVWMTEPLKFEVREYDLPETIEPDAVLIEVLQTNVCGSDLHIAKGNLPHLRCGGIGHEVVGRIVKMGERRTTDNAGQPVNVGDRVVPTYIVSCNNCSYCLQGLYSSCLHSNKYMGKQNIAPYFHGATYATHYYIHHDQYFYKVPEGITNQEASSANCALTQVYSAIDKANVKPGDSLVIQGAGGLGINACAVAKERGAKVIIIDTVDSRLELAKRFGADHVINMEGLDLRGLTKRVRELTNGMGADFGMEVAGVPAAFSQGPHLLRNGGKYIVMGNISIGQKVEVDPAILILKAIKILPFAGYEPMYLYKALQFLERNVNKYPFNELTDAAFTLEEVAAAIDKSIKREVTRATIVVNQ